MTAIKWAGKSRDKIEGLLAPYGGPDFLAGKDLDGEFFSPNTDFALQWFGDWERPLLYHHGLDSEIKTSVVGRLAVKLTDAGLWMQAQLDKASEYYDAIAELVDKKALGLSSGSVSHLVAVDGKSGEIKSWPLIEGSLTPTPANPDAKAAYSVKATDAIAHLALIGVEAPDAIKEPDEPTPDEAVPDAQSEAPVADEPIKMSMAEMGQMMMAQMVSAVTGALTPQALHDAAKASGATCDPMGEMEAKAEPAPLLAVAGKSAETSSPVDLDAIKAHLRDVAVATAKELLGS